MEDFERYGDDNAIDEESTEHKKKIRPLRILLGLFLAVFILFFALRLFLFDYYPKAMKELAMTPALSAAVENGAEVYSQDLRFPYDDNDLDTLNSNDLGSFFCDYLYVCPEAGELQITLRMNESTFDRVAEKYGKTVSVDCDLSAFSFRLYDDDGNEYETVTYREETSFWMYRYVKLAFSGVPLTDDIRPSWIRVEIFYEGEETPYSYALIYETGDNHPTFQSVKVK